MNPSKRLARIVGALFLALNITFIVGTVVLIEPVLSGPDHLAAAAASRSRIVLGVLFNLSCCVSYLGIAVLLYPVLRRYSEGLALGYAGLRVIEFVMQVIADLAPLALVRLGEAPASTGAPASSSLAAVVAALLAQRFWAFQMLSIAFGLGALLFYLALHRLKLVPRFITIWGLAGVAAVLVNAGLDMFGVKVPNLGGVMLANELFLGGWLLIRGFGGSAQLEGARPTRERELTASPG